jgi:hypothetical protein
MKTKTTLSSFKQVNEELAELEALRKDLMAHAFMLLEQKHQQLAQALLQYLRDRRKAEVWMATKHRVFDGKTAYEYLDDSGEDLIWDELEQLDRL